MKAIVSTFNKNIRIIPVLLFMIIFTHLALAQSPPGEIVPADSQAQTLASQSGETQFHQAMLKEITAQNRRISLLTIALGFILVLSAVIIILLVRRYAGLVKQHTQLYEKMAQGQLQKGPEQIARELTQQLENYKDILSGKLNMESESEVEGILKAEIIKNSIWTLISPQIIRAYAKENWQEYLKGWNNYHKLNLALAQVMSGDDEEMWTGMGAFLEMHAEGLMPQSLWELIIMLKDQDRLTAPGKFTPANIFSQPPQDKQSRLH